MSSNNSVLKVPPYIARQMLSPTELKQFEEFRAMIKIATEREIKKRTTVYTPRGHKLYIPHSLIYITTKSKTLPSKKDLRKLFSNKLQMFDLNKTIY